MEEHLKPQNEQRIATLVEKHTDTLIEKTKSEHMKR